MSTTPDPRPRLRDDRQTLEGRCCPSCGWSTTSSIDRCALCTDQLVDATFGPEGTVWSSTVVRVAVPGRTPPYAVGYIDLDDGPRVLCHFSDTETRAPVGSRVSICGSTNDGDVMVQVTS